jgi:beta-galactosidase
MTFKSGFANENSAVRWVRMPGPLREAAGFSYQEFSNLEQPLALKGDPFHVGTDNKAMYWAEFLMPEHARALAYYDHPFFGRWPAITENQYGSGRLLYEGTYLTDGLQRAILKDALSSAGLTGTDQQLPPSIHVVNGIDRLGKRLHYYFNYSQNPASFVYSNPTGKDLLTNMPVATSQQVTLAPWGLSIVEEP